MSTHRVIKPAVIAGIIGIGGYYAFDSRATIHSHIVLPLLRLALDAEDSHRFGIWAIKNGLFPRDRTKSDPSLSITVTIAIVHCLLQYY